ncbi:MAG: uracil-DNA glycosylase family protein [Adhaeribacter sp.]
MLITHLEKKYGFEITRNLISEGRLLAQNIKEKNDSDQTIVKNHLIKLDQELSLGLQIPNTNWAFDFPGWLGSLNSNGSNYNKKFMVVGLEPHVENYDYQITYGLSETTPGGKERFEIEKEKPEKHIIKCNCDSSLIWSNLFHLLATGEEINEVYRKPIGGSDKEAMMNFLSQFYITDLCHFAPQDKAKAVFNIKNWKKIRFKVANHFLKSEIDIVKPKVIIAQGNGVFSELRKILGLKEEKKYLIEVGKVKWSIKKAESTDNNYTVLSLPHFGSQMNYKTFWMKKRDGVRELLINNNLIIV